MNDLTDYELKVITSCRKLLAETNESNTVRFAGGIGEDTIHIVKNKGIWCKYFAERGKIFDYKEFNDVYDALLDLLGSDYFPNEYICYYMTNFPSKLYFEEGNRKTR